MQLFSIIIPTFNSSTFINRAIDSIIQQTYTQWEILIMDGASTDNTIQIAQSYNDKRIRIYSEFDNGIYDAMNKGIEKASGNWLYFLGSDDYLLNNDVLYDVSNHIPEQCDIFYGDVDAPQLDKRHKGEWNTNNIEYNRCHQAIFYSKQFFKKNGNYNIKYKVLADFALNLQWLLSNEIDSYYYPINISHYSEGGISEKITDDLFYNDYNLILLKYGRNKLSLDKLIDIVYDLLLKQSHFSIKKIYYYILHKLFVLKRIIKKKSLHNK